MYYFLLGKRYCSWSIIYYSSIHCQSTWHPWQLEGTPKSLYWGLWSSGTYSGQMESSQIAATTFNRFSLKIPNGGLQANSEEILEREQQACCYYQGNTCCFVLKVGSPKSLMSLLPIYLGQNFLQSPSLEWREPSPSPRPRFLKRSLSTIQQRTF